jgi:hypothetical protein
MSIEIKITDKTNVAFPIVIKDKRENVIYWQAESGYWWESTCDDNRNELTFKNSNGYWWEKTYDDNGKELTYKNSKGKYSIKGKGVTKEEFEAFLNGTPEYTMEELTVKLGHNFKIKK